MWTQVHVRLLFSRKNTLTLLTRSSCSGDEATDKWLHLSQTKTTTHGSQVHMWAWFGCCAECTTCRILSISAFRFSFPFQLSVSSVSTCSLISNNPLHFQFLDNFTAAIKGLMAIMFKHSLPVKFIALEVLQVLDHYFLCKLVFYFRNAKYCSGLSA